MKKKFPLNTSLPGIVSIIAGINSSTLLADANKLETLQNRLLPIQQNLEVSLRRCESPTSEETGRIRGAIEGKGDLRGVLKSPLQQMIVGAIQGGLGGFGLGAAANSIANVPAQILDRAVVSGSGMAGSLGTAGVGAVIGALMNKDNPVGTLDGHLEIKGSLEGSSRKRFETKKVYYCTIFDRDTVSRLSSIIEKSMDAKKDANSKSIASLKTVVNLLEATLEDESTKRFSLSFAQAQEMRSSAADLNDVIKDIGSAKVLAKSNEEFQSYQRLEQIAEKYANLAVQFVHIGTGKLQFSLLDFTLVSIEPQRFTNIDNEVKIHGAADFVKNLNRTRYVKNYGYDKEKFYRDFTKKQGMAGRESVGLGETSNDWDPDTRMPQYELTNTYDLAVISSANSLPLSAELNTLSVDEIRKNLSSLLKSTNFTAAELLSQITQLGSETFLTDLAPIND